MLSQQAYVGMCILYLIFHVNFDEDVPGTTINVKLMAWHNEFKQRKAFKKELSIIQMFLPFLPMFLP